MTPARRGGSGVFETVWSLSRVAQDRVQIVSQLEVADRAERIDDDVQLEARKRQVDEVRIDVKLYLQVGILLALALHGRAPSRPRMWRTLSRG
jgi:hypothetical protein